MWSPIFATNSTVFLSSSQFELPFMATELLSWHAFYTCIDLVVQCELVLELQLEGI